MPHDRHQPQAVDLGRRRMPETTAVPAVHLHYWAGAKAAAGTAEETVEAATVRAALDVAGHRRDERFRSVLSACSLLLDGVAAHEEDLDRPLTAAVRVEVLPPFAGGA
jgi:molybdopterin synthase sulfur carrier subunit